MILLDQQLPDGEGIALLPRLLERRPGVGVIMMTGQHDLELAIQAIKTGAADFIHKPVKTATLQATVEKVLAGQSPEPEHSRPARRPPAGRSDRPQRRDARGQQADRAVGCATRRPC